MFDCLRLRNDGQTLLKGIKSLYEWGTWETKSFTQCGAQIVQAYDQHLKQWGGFTISMEEYANEIQLINLPTHRRLQKEEKVTNYEQSLFRAIAGQLSWLAQQCCPKLVAPLSLLMGETNCATVDTLL